MPKYKTESGKIRKEKEQCPRDGCTEEKYPGVQMEVHLATDHETPWE